MSGKNADRAIKAIESLGLTEEDIESYVGIGDWKGRLRKKNGSGVYEMVVDSCRAKDKSQPERSASELLAKFDIDGIKYPVDSYGGKTVKDCDRAGWNYVSFRACSV